MGDSIFIAVQYTIKSLKDGVQQALMYERADTSTFVTVGII